MNEIEKFFNENKDEKYANFSKKLIPTKYTILGVRMPLLRKKAKELVIQGFCEFYFKSCEEIFLKGFMIGQLKDKRVMLDELTSLLPYFDNWAFVDCIVGSLKGLKNQVFAFEYFKNCLNSENEFVIRTGIIGIMKNFTNLPEQALPVLIKVVDERYYVKMALAWAFCEFFIKNYDETMKLLQTYKNLEVKKITAQKCRDSFRLSKEQKEEITSWSK